MPTYEFYCPKCKEEFSLTLSLKEYETKDYRCPKCGEKEGLKQQVTPFMTKTSKKR